LEFLVKYYLDSFFGATCMLGAPHDAAMPVLCLRAVETSFENVDMILHFYYSLSVGLLNRRLVCGGFHQKNQCTIGYI